MTKTYLYIFLFSVNYNEYLNKLSPEYQSLLIKFINSILYFLDLIKYNKFILSFIFIVFLFLFYHLCIFIKNSSLRWRDTFFLELAYLTRLKVHKLYFSLNPRGFLNYTFLIRYNSSELEIKKLRERFASQFDSVEARLIYARVNEYISMYHKLYSEKVMDEEKDIIENQIDYAYTILADLKYFYRGYNHKEAVWMPYYGFREKFLDYKEACLHFEPLSVKHNELMKLLEINWTHFFNNFLLYFEKKDKDKLLLIKTFLMDKYKYNLDMFFFDFTKDNFDENLIFALDDCFKELKLYDYYQENYGDSDPLNFKVFLKSLEIVVILVDLDIKITIAENVIFNYLFSVDFILQDLFNSRAESIIYDTKRSLILKYRTEKDFQPISLKINFFKNFIMEKCISIKTTIINNNLIKQIIKNNNFIDNIFWLLFNFFKERSIIKFFYLFLIQKIQNIKESHIKNIINIYYENYIIFVKNNIFEFCKYYFNFLILNIFRITINFFNSMLFFIKNIFSVIKIQLILLLTSIKTKIRSILFYIKNEQPFIFKIIKFFRKCFKKSLRATVAFLNLIPFIGEIYYIVLKYFIFLKNFDYSYNNFKKIIVDWLKRNV